MHSFVTITTPLIAILDRSGQLHHHIKLQLAAYKARWKSSLASNLVVLSDISELPEGAHLIAPSYIDVPMHIAHTAIPSIQELTHYHLRAATIEPTVAYYTTAEEAQSALTELSNLFAFDTETASIISDEQLIALKDQLAELTAQYDSGRAHWQQALAAEESLGALANSTNIAKCQSELEAINLNYLPTAQLIRSKLASSALVMAKNQTTMYSFAQSEDTAFVIDSNPDTDPIVLDFLTSTQATVIMHNALYDARLVYNRTNKFIHNIEDTQLMWATILNHCDTFKSKVGLKGLAGHIYSDWAVSKDLFGIEHKHNPELIHYSGIDAAATFFLYQEALIHPDWSK